MSGSKCRVCREPAIIDLPRHNANFCAEHLLQLCRRQVEKAIKDYDMLSPDDRILVAVSGGKDSLAVWDILTELGYAADGLYIGLGIGEYSDVSYEFTRDFAEERGLRLTTVDLRGEFGYDVGEFGYGWLRRRAIGAMAPGSGAGRGCHFGRSWCGRRPDRS